jgi:predicted nucleic acid-binding protein
VEHDVKGVQVHDARIAASMYVHGVPRLFTINIRDFARFKGLTILHPAAVVAV